MQAFISLNNQPPYNKNKDDHIARVSDMILKKKDTV